KYKKIKDYVYPSFITAATTDKGIFGIPNNQAISTKETFFVVNSALAEKYQVDWTKVRSITDLNDVFAQVKAGEPGVTPIYGDFAAEGLSVYTGVDNGGSICVFHDDLLGGKFNAETTNATYNPATTASQAYIEYCAAKAAYRQNEYISDTNENFFLSVQELTEEERAAWEAKGYTTILYKGADFTTEAALENGLFGLSKYCKQPERAMEILQLLTTDADFRNLLAFGVEEVNYVKTAGEHDNVITIVNNNYSMDFNKTGNALLGYVTDQMDPNYAEYAKQKNLNSRLNPFLGFYYDWSTDANKDYVKALGEWAAAVKDKVEQLNYGVENYNEILTTMYDELRNDPTKKFTENYANWQNNCSFRSNYKTYATKLVALDEALHFAAEAITPIGSAN
ncbi:MAG: hypothetical protein IKV50_05460, partial [Clostridia bacterium]|nr:hypothetical protein [Clostridia bacterium]